MNKIIYLSVTNDMVADQRVHRIATTLAENNFDVVVVGRKLHNKSYNFSNRNYKVVLLKIPFKKGFLFYATFNLYLFLYLLTRRNNILVANDLDTIIPNYFVARIKNIPILFDSHEYFPEVPELINRPRIQKVWYWIEKMFVPRISYCYTVCESIANLYFRKYNTEFKVIRNLPFRKENLTGEDNNVRKEKIILYQGALNIGRGIEKVIDAMAYLPDNYFFYILGSGDIEEQLKEKAARSVASERIKFFGRIPLNELHMYTTKANLGISLEDNMGLNYYYALPNKLFDYIQANVPILASDFPEMAKIVNTYQIGRTTNETNPELLAQIINEMITNEEKMMFWKQNLIKAAKELCWENEKKILLDLFRELDV